MRAAVVVLMTVASTAMAAWGPRDALLQHEDAHRAQHEAASVASGGGIRGGGSPAGSHGLAALEARVAEERGRVAALKRTKVDMYRDAAAVAAVADFQAATRELLRARYGAADVYRLDMDVTFPEIMGGETATVSLETAPVALMPHAVHVFLDAAITRKDEHWKCAFHRNAGHVLQAFLRAGGAEGLAFQEYDAAFPHEKFTLGFAGRPGGPEFYVSTVDNVANHGPGSQGSKTEADSCFAKVVAGFDVVKKMQKQPTKERMGFVNDPSDFIVVDDIRLLAS